MFKERNEDIKSVVLRRQAKPSPTSITKDAVIADTSSDGSTQPSNSTSVILVPINSGGKRWGELELVFSKEDGFPAFLKSGSLYLTLLFVAIAGFVSYWIFLKRALTELDPSAVVPDHINAVLDTLSEGIVMLDRSGRVILSNQSFRNKTARLSSELIGQSLSRMHWEYSDNQTGAEALPWDKLLDSGDELLSSEIIYLEPGHDRISFNVHIASIKSPDGQVRGAVVTFDDVTEIQVKNANLKRALGNLENSQREIRRQNDELRILATRDPLTNTLNRRSFFESLHSLFEGPLATQHPISYVMLDLDHFKSVNDNFGHATGDKVIRMTATVLQELTPENGLVGRYGGEEFCVALPGLQESAAAKIADSIRHQVYTNSAEIPELGSRRISASLGVSSDTERKTTVETQLDQADSALYAAKEAGRNQVVCHSQLSSGNTVPASSDDQEVANLPGSAPSLADSNNKIISQVEKDPQAEFEADIVSHADAVHEEKPPSEEISAVDPTKDPGGLIPLAFTDRINQLIKHSDRMQSRLAILIIDFPTIRMLRNAAGEGTANKLLTIGRDRINGVLRSSDREAVSNSTQGLPLTHLGAAQYLALLPDIEEQSAIRVIVHRMLETLENPVQLEGREILLDTRIGTSVYPVDGDDALALVAAANAALNEALASKERNTCIYFSNKLNAQSDNYLYMQSQLHQALERGELFLMYQPLVNMRSGTVSSFEALIRWRHPQLGMISPELFIPIAEQTRLIDEIGEWVILTACTQLKKWNDRGFNDFNMAVNIAAPQLRRTDFVSRVCSIVETTGINPSTLTLELTETTLIENFDVAVSAVNELSAMGARIALDDFGTGYSSLSYLKSFPIDIVKIDRSFFTEFPDDVHSMSIVSAIISMVHSLGLMVIAEGVETSDQLAFLQSLKIDVVQGYHFSAPLTHQQIVSFLDNPEDVRRKFHAANNPGNEKRIPDSAVIEGVLNEAPPWAA
ncbi:MAG: EAL domain-containing protein [Granulosicoccus sp.]